MNEPSVSNTNPWRSRLQSWRERMKGVFPFVSGMLATLLALFLYGAFFPANQVTESEVNDAIASALASATPRSAYSTDVYRIIQPSLVLIEAEIDDENGKEGHGVGSGVIIDDFGDILTALHVVEKAKKIMITFVDGTQSEGVVVSADPAQDIAVLRALQLPEILVPAILGNPGAMQVGDEAFVVGNPFGLYSSMSAGVISGFNRTFRPPNNGQEIRGLIQIDAAVNPGNSGGPLLNRSGQVVGIVTGIINPTDESFFVGIAFAVPINVAAGGAGMPPY